MGSDHDCGRLRFSFIVVWDSNTASFVVHGGNPQEVVFKVDYAVPSIHREFGSVFLGETNIALAVVSAGWAKVRGNRRHIEKKAL